MKFDIIGNESLRIKFLHGLLAIEFIATLVVASIGWSDNVLISSSLRAMRDQDFVQLQTASEIRWINEKLNELSARNVRVQSLNSTQIQEIGQLEGLFASDYAIFKYRFDHLNENLKNTTFSDAQRVEYNKFVDMITTKTGIERDAMASGDKQIFLDRGYQQLLVESNEIMSKLRKEWYDAIRETFTSHSGRYSKHIIAAMIVLIIVVCIHLYFL